ncbi:MAG: M48 family metalloprotease [Bacteroidota bacterium]|jgi:predicted Zn-dependent protease
MRLITVLLTFLFIACGTSRDGDFTLFSVEEDLALGKELSQSINSDPVNYPLIERSESPGAYAQLDRILKHILSSQHILHRDELAWQLHIINNDTIQNAFCTPGGFIYVYTGLMKFVESEDELAGIIAHEVAHGDLRHSTDQLTKQYGIQVLIALLTDSDSRLLADIGASLVQLSYSRSDESEADRYAVRYLKDTPYSPTAFADFFQRMLQKDGNMGVFQFLSTHPDPGNRVEKIKEEAMAN